MLITMWRWSSPEGFCSSYWVPAITNSEPFLLVSQLPVGVHQMHLYCSNPPTTQRVPYNPVSGQTGSSQPHQRTYWSELGMNCSICLLLGIAINQQKSQLLPFQKIQFIGATLESLSWKAYGIESRVLSLVSQAEEVLSSSLLASLILVLLGSVCCHTF